MNGALPADRLGPWRPGKGLPGMGFSGGNVKGGKGQLSESMSLLEEMKLKQEKREQRKRLREEVDSLMASSPQDVSRISRLRQELSYVEGFLAQADGNISLPTHQPQPTGPLTAAEGHDTNNLYVGSLSTEWTEEMLSREFGRFGEITSIKIMYPRTDHQRLRGMNSGFVQFKTRAQAELARSKLNGKEYFGFCLRIDWGRAIQPVRNVGAVMSMGTAPNVISKPALMPHIETPKPMPMPSTSDASQASMASTTERKSRWNLAKTLVVKFPEDQVLKKLIDKTAEFVADEGWEFEKLLLDKEKDNPRFAFMSVEKDNLEEPLHVYYRWRTFSFSQGDNDRFWRTEPFQIYENGPLWQPPPCEKRVEDVPEVIQRIDMLMPSGGQADILLKKLAGNSVSTSGKDNVIGGVGLTPEESSAFQELITGLNLSRSVILKATVFCLDKSMSSLAIAQKISASITEAQTGLTTQQLVARMYLLNDVLYNAHCTRPGASQYRRQFQEMLPDVIERLREVCDGISSIAAIALRERETSIFALLRTVERLRLDDGAHWEAQPAMLEPRDSPAAAALGRNLYICGGDGLQFQPLNSVERFNLDENNWEALPPMFERRSGAAAVALLGQIYVCGGSDGVRRLRSVERYNPDTASWHQVPAMLQQRFAPAAAAVAGKLYVCGGADDRGQLDSVECFDPVRECWGEIPSMHFARVRAAAAAVSD